jgi:glycosyltransferase involved in cell wall biosynthesis
MTTAPKVSVLIPNYNYGHYLSESIQSVLNQTFTDFELIIVDNCSTDNSQEVISKFLEDKRVRFFKNENNIGLIGNWNKCLEYARGEYIKFLLSDDMFYPQLLEKFVPVMDNHPEISIASCSNEGFGVDSYQWIIPFHFVQDGKKVIYTSLVDRNWLASPTAVIFRRSNLFLGGFRNYKWLVDWEMWTRHLTIGDCYIIPEILCSIRNEGSQETTHIYRNFIHLFEEYEWCKKIKTDNEYGLDFTVFDIDFVLKAKATELGRVLIKSLPRLNSKQKRKTFLKAFYIVRTERVFGRVMNLYARWVLSKLFPRYFGKRLNIKTYLPHSA